MAVTLFEAEGQCLFKDCHRNQGSVDEFESMAKVQAWWNSPARKDADAIAEKYASFRVYAVEGASPSHPIQVPRGRAV